MGAGRHVTAGAVVNLPGPADFSQLRDRRTRHEQPGDRQHLCHTETRRCLTPRTDDAGNQATCILHSECERRGGANRKLLTVVQKPGFAIEYDEQPDRKLRGWLRARSTQRKNKAVYGQPRRFSNEETATEGKRLTGESRLSDRRSLRASVPS